MADERTLAGYAVIALRQRADLADFLGGDPDFEPFQKMAGQNHFMARENEFQLLTVIFVLKVRVTKMSVRENESVFRVENDSQASGLWFARPAFR